MDKATEKDLDRSIFIVVFLSYMALCTTNRFTVITLIFPIATLVLVPFTRRLDLKTPLFAKFTSIITIAFLVVLPMYIQSFGLVNGVIALFMYIQLHSLLHKRQLSSFLYILMMSFFLFIATLVLSPFSFIGVVFIGMLAGIVSSLLLLDKWHHLSTGTVLPNHQEGYISTQLKTHTLSKTRRKRSWVLSSAIFCVTLVLFMFFPRPEAGIFGASTDPEQAKSGLTIKTRFDIIGKISDNADHVMSIKFLDIPEGKYDESKYWRAKPFHKYTPQGWSIQGLKAVNIPKAKESTGVHLMRKNLSRAKTERLTNSNYPLIKYKVDFAPDTISHVPLLSTVVSITRTSKVTQGKSYWSQDRDFSVHIDAGSNKQYIVISQPITPSEAQLLQTTDFAYTDMIHPSDYTLLTEHNLEQRTLDLIEKITRKETTIYGKIKTLERHLTSGEYLYTTDIPKLDAEHPVDSFIHDVKRGHCEIYASALALMVRSLGVPTRTINGYRGGIWNELEGTYSVNENMAHLWLEIYFPEFGWVLFDPTPTRVDPEMASIEKFQVRIEYYVTRMQNFWATNIIAYKPKFKMTQNGDNMFAFAGNLFSLVLEGKSTDMFSFTEHLKGVLIILSPLLMVLTIFYMLKRVIRHQKHTRKMQLNEQQTHAREMYLKLIQKLSKLGVNINNLTADELLEQLTTRHVFPPDQVKDITEFLVRYHEVRFGQHALHETELQQYAAMIKQLRTQPAH